MYVQLRALIRSYVCTVCAQLPLIAHSDVNMKTVWKGTVFRNTFELSLRTGHDVTSVRARPHAPQTPCSNTTRFTLLEMYILWSKVAGGIITNKKAPRAKQRGKQRNKTRTLLEPQTSASSPAWRKAVSRLFRGSRLCLWKQPEGLLAPPCLPRHSPRYKHSWISLFHRGNRTQLSNVGHSFPVHQAR
jgi:hypothetical protein